MRARPLPPSEQTVFTPPETLAPAHATACQTIAEMGRDAAKFGGCTRYISRLIASSLGQDPASAIRYGIFTGELVDEGFRSQYVSDTRALVSNGPFGRSAKSTVLSAELLRKLAISVGLRDEQGRTLPVVLFGAPTGKAGMRLPPYALSKVREGDLGPVAVANLKLLKGLLPQVGKVDIFGYSYGASVGAAAARVAPLLGLGVGLLSVGSPGNVWPCSPKEKLERFISEGRRLDYYTPYRTGVFGETPNDGVVSGWMGMFRQQAVNRALLHGLAAGQLAPDLIRAHRLIPNLQTVVAFGTDDFIVPQGAMRSLATRVQAEAPAAIIKFFELPKDRHRWGECARRLGTMAAHAMMRAVPASA